VLTPRNTIALAAAAAALGAATVAVAANGSAGVRGARAAAANAIAYQRQDADGTQRGWVRANGTDSGRATGTRVTASTAGGKGSATATALIRNVNLFGGLVTADAVSVTAASSDAGDRRSGRVKNLVVNGKSLGTVTTRETHDMGGYGKLVVLDDRGRGIVGLHATLTRAYGNFPPGASMKVAYAATSASDAVAPPPQPKPAKPKAASPSKPKPSKSKPAKRRKPPRAKVLLTAKGYVFPVYGKHNYTDTFGAARADTGFHEGNDIFASAGTPVVAVCDGSLNRVGTLPISGNRLWVKCTRAGDSFFYAHLSSYATDAHSGARVHAGQVIGFVGSTGDAEQTPPHLHFEVHPGDGPAVDPFPFLRAWENRRDVPAATWVKANGAGSGEQPGTLVVVRDFLDR
jgi:murein DD-endopeptidase MepM/ murein hydrolase activator NlpD